jgi:uncharacterized protein YjbI with pentapeptide repeats
MGLVALMLTYGIAVAGEDVERLSEVRALGDCENCTFEDQDFLGKKLTGINLSNAALDNVVFDKSEMNISLFEGATLRNVSFVGTNLRGASFVGARLENVSFDGAILSGAVFEGAIMDRTDLQAALLCNTQLPGDLMDRSDCE